MANTFAKDFQTAHNEHIKKGAEGSANKDDKTTGAGANAGAAAGKNGDSASQQNAATATATATPPATPAPGQNPTQTSSLTLSQIFKQQHGIDLSDDEILKRVKTDGGALGPEASQAAAAKTQNSITSSAPVEITDDEVVSSLEKKGKNRDYFNRANELLKMDEFAVVKLHWQDIIKKDDPAITDEDIDALLKEKYFISNQEGDYSPHEISFGKKALKAEADRIRSLDTADIVSVKNDLQNQKRLRRVAEAHNAEVDQFIGKVPRTLDITIGKRGTEDFGVYSFPVNEETVQRISKIMKSPAELAKKFSGPDDTVDLNKLYSLLIKTELFDNAAVSIAEKYFGIGVDKVEARINTHPNLGSNGQNTAQKEANEKVIDHNKQAVEKNIGRSRGGR